MNENEQWEIIREACRISTTSWLAWEKVHAKYSRLKKRNIICLCGSWYDFVYQDNSASCANFNAHRNENVKEKP